MWSGCGGKRAENWLQHKWLIIHYISLHIHGRGSETEREQNPQKYGLYYKIHLWWSKCLKVMHHNWSKVQAGWKPGVLNLQAIWESKVVGPLKKDSLQLYSRLASEIICPSSLPPHKSYIQVPHTWPNYLLLSITAVTCNVTASYCITCSYSIISTIGLFWYQVPFLPRSLTFL